MILEGYKELCCCWRGYRGTRGSQALKNIAVMVCPSCLVVNHLTGLLGDDRKPPDGKVHVLDTLISFHICDYSLAQALQRTTFELPPPFEPPWQYREWSWMTRSYLLGHQPNFGICMKQWITIKGISTVQSSCRALLGKSEGLAFVLHLYQNGNNLMT